MKLIIFVLLGCGNVTMVDFFLFGLQEAGGPKLPMKYGRVDTSSPDECPEEGRLPGNQIDLSI